MQQAQRLLAAPDPETIKGLWDRVLLGLLVECGLRRGGFEAVAGYTRKAGLGRITPHDLRRTFAKLAHLGRAPLEQIQISLGHASIQTTERYLACISHHPTVEAHDTTARTSLRLLAVLNVLFKYACARQAARASS